MQKIKFLFISCDDKCSVKLGAPGNPLALEPKRKTGWIATSVEAKDADHDTFINSNVVPSTMLITDVLNDCNLIKLYILDVHVGLKHNDMHKTSRVRHAVEIVKVLEETSKDKTISRMSTDKGGDRNPKI